MRPGDVLAGKYRVERVLGVGGMGVVVAARHLHLDERVAIKFLLPEVAASGGEQVARFAREGRAAAKIRSEHVARVTDVGTLETGSPYLVLEYLDGHDLGQLLQDQGALGIADAIDYVLQACEALAEAHARGIVHRDLKPTNLFLTRRADGSSCIKVLDFGISKMKSAGEADAMIQTRAVLGSPLYMSPEQMTSTRDVDARTDIWSLGVVLYELLTARLPFNAETMPQLVAQVLQQPAMPLRQHRPEVPEGLEAVVQRCLQKDPAARFEHVGELALALHPFAPPTAHVSIERVARVMGSSPDLESGRSLPVALDSAPTVHGPLRAPPFAGAAVTAGPSTTSPRVQARSSRAAVVAGVAVSAVLVLGGVSTVVALRAHREGTATFGLAPTGRTTSSAPSSGAVSSTDVSGGAASPEASAASTPSAASPSATVPSASAPATSSAPRPVKASTARPVATPRPPPSVDRPKPPVVPDDRQ